MQVDSSEGANRAASSQREGASHAAAKADADGLDQLFGQVANVCNKLSCPRTGQAYGFGKTVIASFVPSLKSKQWQDLWLPGNADEVIIMSDSTLTRSGAASFLSVAQENVPLGRALWGENPASWLRKGATMATFRETLIEALDFFAEFGHCAKYSSSKSKKESNPLKARYYQYKEGTGLCLSEGYPIPHYVRDELDGWTGFINSERASQEFHKRKRRRRGQGRGLYVPRQRPRQASP